jgi:aryl-alcohol dehydrogenase-like predicted oxidoreductase
MKTIRLGTQGLEVSALGLGCMGMSWLYGAGDDEESIRTIRRSLELGVTLLDTAEMYGPYENERLVGRALRGCRDQAIVATKFGFKISDGGGIVGLDSRPDHVKRVADESLGRLGVDHIDLFYQHRLDPEVPIEETVGAMAELVTAGKVRYIGLSEVGVDVLSRAHRVHPITALQCEYSLWERDVEAGLLSAARDLGVGFVAYCPLGRGFLTGANRRAEEYSDDDYRRGDPRLQGQNYDLNLSVLEVVGEIATARGRKPAQVALAWLLQRDPPVVPIPGTRHLIHLEQNCAALDLVLGSDEISRLESAAPPGGTAGPRYSPGLLSKINR